MDLQVAGRLKGTDGQNILSVGVLPAFGLGERLSFFLPLNVISSWDKKFKKFNGLGFGVALLLIITLDDKWAGGYVSVWPNYNRFVSGELQGEGSGNFDLNVGGEITTRILWMLTYQKNFDKYLRSFRPDRDSNLTNDQNLFLQITTYF